MLLYRLIIILTSPFILGHILWKSISNKDSHYFRQRLGFQYSHLPENCLWFHCASVGEVVTALPLLKNLHANRPQLNIVITTNTVTGGKIVAQQKLDYLYHSYLPFDWVYSIKRFIKTVKPQRLYVLETEIWPNLFNVCAGRGIGVHIINARLSSKTSTAKPWVKDLLKTALSKVTSISARTQQDTEGYALLGADSTKITTIGNLKFTTALSVARSEDDSSFAIDRGFMLVASTHDDEELQIYNIWKQLHRQELLIIAPRHPERAPAIIKNLACNSIAIRSKNQPVTDGTSVYLLDTVGELKNYLKHAKLVVMGGSFVPVGGHNILEPASFNRAIITGPYMENFRQELALMQEKDAIVQVASYDELATQLSRLLDDDNDREQLENNTAKLTHNVAEVLQKYTELILG